MSVMTPQLQLSVDFTKSGKIVYMRGRVLIVVGVVNCDGRGYECYYNRVVNYNLFLRCQ